MRPKLILTDLDGTLLREDKTLSPINRAPWSRPPPSWERN